MRVGVFSLFRPQRLVVKPAAAEVLRVEIDGRAVYLEGAQSAAFRRVDDAMDCFVRRELVTARRARVAGRDGGAANFLLSVPGSIERRFRGTLEVASRAGALEAVVSLDIETAVASVVAAESPPGAPFEALKAQAVVARSYYLATRGRHAGFDFCDTTHCQFLREPASDESAARETAGLALLYQREPVAALYSASCGGRTKSLEEIGLPAEGYPYYSVDCEACRREAREWTARFSGPDAAASAGASAIGDRASGNCSPAGLERAARKQLPDRAGSGRRGAARKRLGARRGPVPAGRGGDGRHGRRFSSYPESLLSGDNHCSEVRNEFDTA